MRAATLSNTQKATVGYAPSTESEQAVAVEQQQGCELEVAR
ncbi:hypothetical protein [Parathermosynechococcus lividus]